MFYSLIVELEELTEQAKIAYLQEKIKEVSKKKRSGWISTAVGFILAIMGYALYIWKVDYYRLTALGQEVFLRSEYPYQLGGILAIIAGIALTAIGFVENIYCATQEAKFMEQLRLMATTIKCPKCGKQILKKTPYCPFCGKPLENS